MHSNPCGGSLSIMDAHLEAKEIANVRLRLAERFSTLDGDTIEAAVRAAHAEMTGRIRDYVPVLVEHKARERLSAFARHGQLTSATMRSHASPDVRGRRTVLAVAAEVEVDGDADHVDFRPYAVRSQRNGATSVLTFDVHDSHEFVRVLRAVVSHGLHITRAQLSP